MTANTDAARFARYLHTLEERGALPDGFWAATASLSFTSKERGKSYPMNLSLILLEEPTESFAGVFTRNRFAGAPVLIGRQRLQQRRLRGVLVNNKVANVGAPGGLADAEALCARLGELVGCDGTEILPASTGVVGWKLPVAQMLQWLPALAAGRQQQSLLPVARAIMTTDSYPKLHREKVGRGSIVGVAKGAGMIEPNMGTMLAFLLTDLAVEPAFLRQCLAQCVQDSFNRISVDGDQSTSDMAVALSSGRRPPARPPEFRKALLAVCRRLAEDVVRNGEGVAHVLRVWVRSASSEQLAVGAGKAVVNSPLVKTAVFGNDPNVGRIVAALGDYCGSLGGEAGEDFDLGRLRVRLGGTEIFRRGSFCLDARKESHLAEYLSGCAQNPQLKGFPQHDRTVDITVDLGLGKAEGEVLGSDLSFEYVRENAEYRS
jgi:glutamate N-acetyltransferase/amino-acid N-acetyltransferase